LLISVVVPLRKIQGKYKLPEGCSLEIVGWGAKFEDDELREPTLQKLWNRLKRLFVGTQARPVKQRQQITYISCNYNLVKILVALGQALYAITTLYQTRGDQIDQYGYASFGLTVTPYALMSVVNLLGNLARPAYPVMYIVQPADLDGIEEVDGIIGTLEAPHEAPVERHTGDNLLLEICTIIACGAVQIAIVGALSSFHKGSSTTAQRVWTMTWLVVGCCVVKILHTGSESMFTRYKYKKAMDEYNIQRVEWLITAKILLVWCNGVNTKVSEWEGERLARNPEQIFDLEERIQASLLHGQVSINDAEEKMASEHEARRVARDEIFLALENTSRQLDMMGSLLEEMERRGEKLGSFTNMPVDLEELRQPFKTTIERVQAALNRSLDQVPDILKAMNDEIDEIDESDPHGRLRNEAGLERHSEQQLFGGKIGRQVTRLYECLFSSSREEYQPEAIPVPFSSASDAAQIQAERRRRSPLFDLPPIGEQLRTSYEDAQSRRRLREQHLEDVLVKLQNDENNIQFWKLGLYALCSAPAIGGFVVVGQMLHAYGSCVRIA
jgi:hypothetical protein